LDIKDVNNVNFEILVVTDYASVNVTISTDLLNVSLFFTPCRHQ